LLFKLKRDRKLILKLRDMDEYILIFRHEDGHKVASPEQIEKWMKQTKEWMAGISPPGKVTGGNGLSFKDARVINHRNIVANVPFGIAKETIGGYIIIATSSIDEAVEFAKGCPVLQGEGNSVEVRRIAKK
jgi:hypothetical protein